MLPGSAGGPFVGRLAGLAGWQAVVVRRAEGLTYFHVLLHTRFPHQMALNAGVHTHDISILTTSSSCAALKETSINELANYKSLVQCYIQKGAVPFNHRERFKIWFLNLWRMFEMVGHGIRLVFWKDSTNQYQLLFPII